jgi:hypothetical protein
MGGRVLGLIGRIPLLWMAPIAGWLAVAPIVPEPHLVEKLRILSQGFVAQSQLAELVVLRHD